MPAWQYPLLLCPWRSGSWQVISAFYLRFADRQNRALNGAWTPEASIGPREPRMQVLVWSWFQVLLEYRIPDVFLLPSPTRLCRMQRRVTFWLGSSGIMCTIAGNNKYWPICRNKNLTNDKKKKKKTKSKKKIKQTPNNQQQQQQQNQSSKQASKQTKTTPNKTS